MAKYGITLAVAQAQLELWIEASQLVSRGQSYTIGNRSLTRADLSDILDMIEFWEDEVAELETVSSSGGRIKQLRIVPRDA